MVGLNGEFSLPEELNDELVLVCGMIEITLSSPGNFVAKRRGIACKNFREALSLVWGDLVFPTGTRKGVPCGVLEVFKFMAAAATVSYHARILEASLVCSQGCDKDQTRLDALFARKIEDVCDAVRLHYESVFEEEDGEISD